MASKQSGIHVDATSGRGINVDTLFKGCVPAGIPFQIMKVT